MRIYPRQLIVLGLFGVLFALFIVEALLSFSNLRVAYKRALHISRQWSAEVASYGLGVQNAPKPVRTRQQSDDMTQVYIPAGKFLMGTDDPAVEKSNPQHEVTLSAYWIDQIEVTNAMYLRCVEAGACDEPYLHGEHPYYDKPGYENYPVVFVTWFSAKKYCAWAGRRLPTEAEWEKAARGIDGRSYPWGESAPEPALANFGGLLNSPLPVDRYPGGASPFGVLNMAGNVREWVSDWFNQVFYRNPNQNNPTGPKVGTERVLRGGSFLDDARELRVFNRFEHDPSSPGINRGFRCAMDAEKQP